MLDLNLDGRRALVTGSSSGIGRGLGVLGDNEREAEPIVDGLAPGAIHVSMISPMDDERR